MLKLIFHTAVFGPIHLEYDRPVIRVGSSEDNDLVLRDASIAPHHCQLVFRGEKVLCVDAGLCLVSAGDLRALPGPEYGLGDMLRIGNCQFSLAHSPRTVALPELLTGGSPDSTEPSDADTRQPRYYCEHCRVFVPEDRVKRVGLVGHAKRTLCPKCSSLLTPELVSAGRPK